MKEVVIPAVGFAMEEALLVRWHKAAGDVVAAGEPIAEIETDKVTTDLESPASGRLGPLLAEAGAMVPVGTPLTHILEETDLEVAQPQPIARRTAKSLESPAPGAAPSADSSRGPAGGPAGRSGLSTPITPQPSANAEPIDAVSQGQRLPHRLTPRQRMAARQAAVPASALEAPQDAEPGTAPATAVSEAGVKAGSFRSLIAARVAESWRTIPHFAVVREVNAEAMLSIRADHARREQRVPSITDLLLRALAVAFEATDVTGPIDIGLAVATDRGVVIPVIRGANRLDLDEIGSARRAAIDRAKSGRLTAADLDSPPPSTLSNLGPFGIDQFTGIVATGQTSLLTVGRVARRVVPTDDGIRVQPTFQATLNVDHRIYDGADAARLLIAFVAAAEDPVRLARDPVA